MTALSIFTDEEQELIISLPYRAGLWVSYAEDEDGEEDDEKEMAALESALTEIAGLHADNEFMRDVMQATLARKDQWPSWSQGVFQTPNLAQQAIAILKQKATAGDAKNYRATVMEIATAVAQAYGEFGEEEEPDSGFFGGVMARIAGGFSGLSHDDEGHPMNVSAAEDSAISRLSAALKTE